MSTFITNKQWESALRRICNANLKAYKTSMSEATMSNHSHDLIFELLDDGRFVADNWRDELNRRFLIVKSSH